MSVEHFEYDLPEGRIAQTPAMPRDTARLLVSRPDVTEDRRFSDLPDLLRSGDLVVLNDTRVFPARLSGQRPSGGKMEVFLLRPLGGEGAWEALVRSNKRVRFGMRVLIGDGLEITIQGRTGSGFQVILHHPGETLEAVLERHGQVPLPPYINPDAQRDDRHRYQTVFARHDGAVAAPTAGLHFTTELLQRLADRQIGVAFATLHVGLGTFQPLRGGGLAAQHLHREWCCLPEATVAAITATQTSGGRVIAVGTTVVRTLETAARQTGVPLAPWQGETNLFIRPGDPFLVIDGMITNFHLPRSSLLMLVGAFVGLSRLDRDYELALSAGYRFYSYGDASLLWPG
ncbi:MAG: tRNA preQ1(34) S-adenosylmethionine ribosyltransferase-isomerase QueA [Magnetococcales bacterium]|nr:tRNA preQ1(34) S-adenosylmethionine ribosyltransferase-isomerase QueA [Magnetococcales bacterium]